MTQLEIQAQKVVNELCHIQMLTMFQAPLEEIWYHQARLVGLLDRFDSIEVSI